MDDKLKQLKEAYYDCIDLMAAAAVMVWDQEAYMPPGGASLRADQVSTLHRLAHEYATDDKIGRLLEDLAEYEQSLDYDSDEASLIRAMRREYENRTKLPADLVARTQHASARGSEAWKAARNANDFKIFQPVLEEIVDLRLEWAEHFAPYDNVYDPMCDYFEPGMTYAQISEIFNNLRPPLVELVQAIVENKDAADRSVMRRHFDADTQLVFVREILEKLGYDFNHGRIDFVTHPFAIGFGRDDVRVTTRIHENFLPSCLFGTIHESGHAMYEQNLSPAHYRTLLAQGASSGVHESQSRFWENIVARSRAFWAHFYPRAQELFSALHDVDQETFYRAVNQSEPSLNRVGADEVTYGLHIMLRFELENDMVNGRVKVADLPEAWNARMEDYLGVVPPDDLEGVLQDPHWSLSYFGYIHGYLLGNIFSAQQWASVQQDIPDVVDQIAAGQFENILNWLVEHIHLHGRKFTIQELCERATGQPLTWEPYMQYLNTKYGEIYGL